MSTISMTLLTFKVTKRNYWQKCEKNRKVLQALYLSCTFQFVVHGCYVNERGKHFTYSATRDPKYLFMCKVFDLLFKNDHEYTLPLWYYC